MKLSSNHVIIHMTSSKWTDDETQLLIRFVSFHEFFGRYSAVDKTIESAFRKAQHVSALLMRGPGD